ncbi:hypothetical protein [Sphingobacterium bovistauri]|uniref:Uncharacterized protein n=1 Tax=Sphingobacterium bovistauri TaxID=2781959 RepID=A0ABS7Z2B1_9SPHI|nr:hypothetical protein [Sphingobacterium bovistauri]MCA5003702.1 hypothetical protein [Sphingobacterium bovistauri]
MKIKLLILAIGISLLNIMCCGIGGNCCGNDGPYKTYKFRPTGKIDLFNTDNQFLNIKDTIRGVFNIKLEFDTEEVYANNFSIVPMAMACSMYIPDLLNKPNFEKLSISIDHSFVYKNKQIAANTNLIRSSDIQFNYMDIHNNPNIITFDEKFLYYAKFEKGWTNFTIEGELEDGQKFTFEKDVYLDL